MIDRVLVRLALLLPRGSDQAAGVRGRPESAGNGHRRVRRRLSLRIAARRVGACDCRIDPAGWQGGEERTTC